LNTCASQLDCFNNGFAPGTGTTCGAPNGCETADLGFCKVGKNQSSTFCSETVPCANPQATCDSPSANPDNCKAARKNDCFVIPPGSPNRATAGSPYYTINPRLARRP